MKQVRITQQGSWYADGSVVQVEDHIRPWPLEHSLNPELSQPHYVVKVDAYNERFIPCAHAEPIQEEGVQ